MSSYVTPDAWISPIRSALSSLVFRYNHFAYIYYIADHPCPLTQLACADRFVMELSLLRLTSDFLTYVQN